MKLITRKYFSALITTLTLTLSLNSFAEVQYIKGVITKESDGDTVHILPDSARGDMKLKLKVRMDWMDTPETHLPLPGGGIGTQGYFGDEAARVLGTFLKLGDKVILAANGKDKYGRTLGRIINSKNYDINLQMVNSGWAVMYLICDSVCDLKVLKEMNLPNYRAACNTAIKEGRGMFNPSNPIPELPFEFRARMMKKDFVRPIGNMKTKTYLPAKDYKKVPICDRLFFQTEADAIRLGFKAAR